MSYFKHIQQEVIASIINSSTVALKKYPVSGYNFTGIKESTLGVAGIQVSCFADQNCTIYIEQSPDGDYWDISDVYTYRAITHPNFGVTVQAVSSYVRVRAENLSTTTDMTAFRLQTALCPIAEALPRALDAEGNLAVGVKSSKDLYGFDVENTPHGEMRMVEPIRMVGASFEGTTLDTNFWTATNDAGAGPGSVTQALGQAVVNSGTTTTSYATLFSVRRARHIVGTGSRYRANLQLGDTGTASNVKRWGMAYGTSLPTITDGAWFQTSGTTFGVATKINGSSASVVSNGSFNGDYGATYVLDTNVNTYEIYYTPKNVYFVINGKVLHTVSASAATWTETLSFHVFADNTNSGNTVNKTISLRSSTIYRLGKAETAPIWRNINTTAVTASILKRGPGRLHKVCINSSVNSTVVSLYDALSATNPIAIITPTNGTTPFTVDFKLDFYTGLCVTTTPNSANVTFIWE